MSDCLLDVYNNISIMDNIPLLANRSKDNRNIGKQVNRLFLFNTTKYLVTIRRESGE